jgi:hypothetical protein
MVEPSPDELVERLARLTDATRSDTLKKARVARRRLIEQAIVSVRSTLLAPIKSKRRVSAIIDDAKNNRHGRFAPGLLTAVRQELEKELGSLGDIPGSEITRRW